MTKVICDRRDCKFWVDGDCTQKKIRIIERTVSPNDEIAVCSSYRMVAGVC